ncbi:hypothetical protein CN305_13755 [Bacillus cereus]|uniref:hypothetical protein n=1 Tax=Bacillus cereus TaxID=1396 RepID=UPI000BF47087|nr:hypothetical protein [Bacillus cereus]PFD19272.1 hypothetical protein CN305_13755 [Bacillus cereus]
MNKIYGPDQNLDLDLGKVERVSVPTGHKARFSFKADAAWEQAICIYLQNAEVDYGQVIEKGTYAPLRDLDDWDTPVNHSESDKVYIVSGWYKHHGWAQSRSNKSDDEIGFDDGGNDSDYNDIVATYVVEKE